MIQHLITDGQPVAPKCPYCDDALIGQGVGGMHSQCAVEFREELEMYDAEMSLDGDWDLCGDGDWDDDLC